MRLFLYLPDEEQERQRLWSRLKVFCIKVMKNLMAWIATNCICLCKYLFRAEGWRLSFYAVVEKQKRENSIFSDLTVVRLIKAIVKFSLIMAVGTFIMYFNVVTNILKYWIGKLKQCSLRRCRDWSYVMCRFVTLEGD